MGRETVFVIDDNRQIANFLVGTLLPSLGYETLVAYDGKSALKIVKEHHRYIDLIILDLQLPDTTGLELLRQMQSEDYSIPTILFTAHGSEQVAVDAFRLGVQDYLHKPVDEDALREAITRALSGSRLRREKAALTVQLQEQVSWLTTLSKVGQSVTSTLDLDEVLRRIVEAGVQLTHADEGFIALLDDESGQLYLRAVKNIDEDIIRTMRLPVSDSLVGNVIQQKRPMRASQSTGDSLLKVSTGYLVHSLMHVPILSKGIPLGVLSVDNRSSKRPFQDKDEAVLRSLADYAAIALENAGLYHQAQEDLAERRRMEVALRESEERYALAVRGANDGLWDWDMRTHRVYYSPRWKSMLGYSEDEVKSTPGEWFDRLHPDDVDQVKVHFSAHLKGLTPHFESEHRIRHKDGSYRWMLCRGIAVWDEKGQVTRIAGSQTDITARKVAEQRLLHDAFYDSLTDLPNRALFLDRLKHVIDVVKRRPNFLYAVLFLDIDRFKDINDSMGHTLGDEFLAEVGGLLRSTLRPADTVARLGGDEFVILLEDINDISDATLVANRIQEKLTTTPLLSEHTLFVTASIGIVLSVSGYERPEDVLRDADIAMYRAKANGRARYEIFDQMMRERIMERLALESELRQALERSELDVHYQPIVSLQTGRVIGIEALARWRHPNHGMIMPGRFIPLAEETGLIIDIDRWVLRQACMHTREWQLELQLDPPLSVNVNISGKQFSQPDLVDIVDRVLQESGLEADQLHLEITESVIMENFEHTAETLRQLRDLGVQIEIDDFGVGYSSLNYLSRFPLNALKIDRSFIAMMADESSLKIIQAIVQLTHGLGLGVIAEGVETTEQLSVLKEIGGECIQGRIVAMPVDRKEVHVLLEKSAKGESVLPV